MFLWIKWWHPTPNRPKLCFHIKAARWFQPAKLHVNIFQNSNTFRAHSGDGEMSGCKFAMSRAWSWPPIGLVAPTTDFFVGRTGEQWNLQFWANLWHSMYSSVIPRWGFLWTASPNELTIWIGRKKWYAGRQLIDVYRQKHFKMLGCDPMFQVVCLVQNPPSDPVWLHFACEYSCCVWQYSQFSDPPPILVWKRKPISVPKSLFLRVLVASLSLSTSCPKLPLLMVPPCTEMPWLWRILLTWR
jgi:hypothetical protein